MCENLTKLDCVRKKSLAIFGFNVTSMYGENVHPTWSLLVKYVLKSTRDKNL